MSFHKKQSAILALFTATSLMAAPICAAPLDIADVTVVTNLEAVEANALDRWPEIAGDLTIAITSGLADHLQEGGDYHITVDVTEISNAGTTLLGNDGAFNQLNGWVYIDGPDSEEPLKKMWIELSAEEGATLAPSDITIVAPKRIAFYDALVTAFTYKVVSEVSELQTEWLVPEQAEENT
ncbi:hypothetical protein SAMN04488117_101163 [Celeribacter baekdonensis]|uniref:Uncharacterized protein n=1 Tax=Celeribacter baekdonensis TaxID=875171 RepID=A0A1G7FNQ5_9RHOB|nr:hypothetical protein [Celeribacter baekdonensis]SDE77295.1 hypothetical protein SAMN04488117_101163 [Celeribacter baekdonensis]